MILKYAYTLNILIHQIVHMEYFDDDTLPILQNFERTIFVKKNLIKLHSRFLHFNSFLKFWVSVIKIFLLNNLMYQKI